MKTASIVFCLTGLVSLAGCQEQQTTDRPEIHRHSEIELKGPMPQAFRDFVNHVDPYGAFFVTKTGGGGGRIGGQPSREAAISAALGHCQEQNPGVDCVLYATKTP